MILFAFVFGFAGSAYARPDHDGASPGLRHEMRLRFAHEPRPSHEARPVHEARPAQDRMRPTDDHAAGMPGGGDPSLRDRLCHRVGLCLEKGTAAEVDDKAM